LTNNKPNGHEILFSVEEVTALLEILSFAKETCAFMEEQEVLKGSESGVTTMRRIKQDSSILLNIIIASVTIGEPTPGVFH